jgi:hypothetical protein
MRFPQPKTLFIVLAHLYAIIMRLVRDDRSEDYYDRRKRWRSKSR